MSWQSENQTALITQLLNVSTNLDLVSLNARDAARALYNMLGTEDESGRPKKPDVSGARKTLYQTHDDGTQVR